MTQREDLYRGTSRAAWGCFFLYFNINLGPVNILPAFGAYLLFLSAIRLLEGEVRDLSLLRPFGAALAVWNILAWSLAIFGADLSGRLPVVQLVLNLMELWFFFQLFTDLAELAKRYETDGEVSRRLLRWRTVQILLLMVLALPWEPLVRRWEAAELLMAGLSVTALAACLCIMASIFALRRLFREEAAPEQGG